MAVEKGVSEMLVFFYPNNDYTAAELSGKVQVLAAAKGLKVYSPPRNFMMSAYDRATVARKLKTASHAVFLAYDVTELDEHCKEEIAVLISAGVPIRLLVPKKMVPGLSSPTTGGSSGLHVHSYDPHEPGSLYDTLKQVVEELSQRGNPPVKADTARREATAAYGALLVFFALLIVLILVFAGNEE